MNMAKTLFICLIVLAAVIGTTVCGKPTIQNGKVMKNGKVKCKKNYMYSKESPIYDADSPGECLRYKWSGKCVNEDEEFTIPRAPGTGWSVCLTASTTKYTRATFDLFGVTDGVSVILLHFDIRMRSHGSYFDDSFVVNERATAGGWYRQDNFHPDPYPFAVGKNFKLEIGAVDSNVLSYAVNGKVYGNRTVVRNVNILTYVKAHREVCVTKINTWCT